MAKSLRKVFYIVLLLFFSLSIHAQEPGDDDYVFSSLEEAKRSPDQVYHLQLEKEKLEAIPESFFEFGNLRTLSLRKNKISQIPIRIGELKELEKLDLSKNEITILPPQLGELNKLRFLYLSKNDVEKIPEAVGNLKHLEELDLWLNNVKEISPAIYELTDLKLLDLRGMIFPKELKQELTENLPDTEIFFSNGCDCGF